MRLESRVRYVGAAISVLLLGLPIGADYSVNDIVDAAKRGDIHAVHRLIETAPEKVDDTDARDFTALHWAGIRPHWRIFSELLAADAPPNAVGGDGGTPLHWACHNDNAAMIALLLDAGAEVDASNRWGRTPLHVAARRGCDDVTELLLERGADPDAVTAEGWTPLHVAKMSGHPTTASILVAGGADRSARDNDGQTPAEVARARPKAVAVNPAVLDDYVGIYDLGHGASVKVWRHDGGLSLREFAPDGLYPIGKDAFHCVQEPWRVGFLRDEEGDVETIVLHYLRRSVKGTRTASPRYVGVSACTDCHSTAEAGNPHVTWMRSRHGHAYWRLGSDWSRFLAGLRPHYADLTDPMADHRCLLCHVTGRQDDNALFAESYREEEGIGCESCHGPGSLYSNSEIMGDREAFLAAGGVVPTEATCRSCHRRSENFDFEEMLGKVAHRVRSE
ncbi:MAG: ankyrin repeat domain-containing protein [Thermoanaerobaculales bacterium]|jgi:hypothetical protein|nr:ankyrin repeat domain-containing protein [Thermoanaerobaculales bacterium]